MRKDSGPTLEIESAILISFWAKLATFFAIFCDRGIADDELVRLLPVGLKLDLFDLYMILQITMRNRFSLWINSRKRLKHARPDVLLCVWHAWLVLALELGLPMSRLYVNAV